MLSQMWHELWVLIFVALIAIGIFTGEGLLIGFSVMGLLVVGTARLWNRVSLENVTYERELSQRRVFIGEKTTLSITLTNRKPLPLGRVRVEDEVPVSMELDGADVVGSPNPEAKTLLHSASMSWYERIRWTYEFQCSRRGFFRIGPPTLRSGDLFGFFSSEITTRDRDYVLVYPRVVSLPEIGMPSARPLGETRGGIRIFEDISRPMGLRDYHTGDPLKTVDWKATARTQELQVRTYEPSSSMTVILAVAVDTMAHTWEGLLRNPSGTHNHGRGVARRVCLGTPVQPGAVLERHAGARGQADEDRLKPVAGPVDDYSRSARFHSPATYGFLSRDSWGSSGAAFPWARLS